MQSCCPTKQGGWRAGSGALCAGQGCGKCGGGEYGGEKNSAGSHAKTYTTSDGVPAVRSEYERGVRMNVLLLEMVLSLTGTEKRLPSSRREESKIAVHDASAHNQA